ncbi:MAG: recombination mediator RecR [Bacteroidota bacterium]|nr:recombination mediator RecR [Bacteroidota bacterium]MEC8969065.1 recombination mediator RecR [Bacteroidota bacterium]|tara:strand:+ start:164 stop:781 length:618 start_codon:yes stop_codon:yes gene_type:complete
MDFKSKILNQAVEQMASLPGIGKRTALRLVLHLLNKEKQEVAQFSNSFLRLKENIQFCKRCHNISDSDLCSICNNPKRDSTLVCVVQDIRDVMAIESTGQFFGEYHVLGGVISPMDGIGPEDLTITSLLDRIDTFSVKEIIFGLPATMEGDTTNFFIYRKIQDKKIKTSLISRGIGVGNQLEYIDEITLGKSIVNRSPYEINFSS